MPKNPKPPSDAGAVSKQTLDLRGPMRLTVGQRRRAKRLREIKMDWPDVAAIIGRSIDDIQHDLATARTPSPNPKRATLNVSLESAEVFVKDHLLPGEKVYSAFNRLMGV